jgi:hypothetical protein
MALNSMPPAAVVARGSLQTKATAVPDVVEKHRVFSFDVHLKASAQVPVFGHSIGLGEGNAGSRLWPVRMKRYGLDSFGVLQGREQTRQHGHRRLSRHGGFQDVSRRTAFGGGFHTSIQNPNPSLSIFSENRTIAWPRKEFQKEEGDVSSNFN